MRKELKSKKNGRKRENSHVWLSSERGGEKTFRWVHAKMQSAQIQKNTEGKVSFGLEEIEIHLQIFQNDKKKKKDWVLPS